jgi:hypothetical protein
MKSSHINFVCSAFIILIIIFGAILAFILNPRLEVEGFDNKNISDSFCNTFGKDSSKLQEACGRLTGKNCKNMGCCVFTNGEKCLAGGVTGPTYKTDSNGEALEVDNYYYLNKCYGTGCSN